jgi:hypothetical protein
MGLPNGGCFDIRLCHRIEASMSIIADLKSAGLLSTGDHGKSCRSQLRGGRAITIKWNHENNTYSLSVIKNGQWLPEVAIALQPIEMMVLKHMFKTMEVPEYPEGEYLE